MPLVGASDAANATNGFCISDMTAKRVARIGGVRNQPSTVNNLYDRRNLPGLWVRRMNVDESGHARIVGQIHGQFACI